MMAMSKRPRGPQRSTRTQAIFERIQASEANRLKHLAYESWKDIADAFEVSRSYVQQLAAAVKIVRDPGPHRGEADHG